MVLGCAAIVTGAIALASPRGEDAPESVRAEVIELFREADRLRERGSVEDAEHLAGRAEELIHLAREREELIGRLERMRREMAELRETGRIDRAEVMEREARGVATRLEELNRRLDVRERHGPQIEERIHHLRQAAEHLQAAGREDWAREIRNLIAKEESETHQRAASGGGEELHARVNELAQAVRELNAAVREMRRIVDELQSQRAAERD
jgi:hypothetical protein